MKTGIERIRDERNRQIEVEGWTALHDDYHFEGQLGRAACCYASTAKIQIEKGVKTLPSCYIHKDWPWERKWWKPSNDPVRNLEKSGALFIAESERLGRAGDLEESEGVMGTAEDCGSAIDRLLAGL